MLEEDVVDLCAAEADALRRIECQLRCSVFRAESREIFSMRVGIRQIPGVETIIESR